MRSASVPRVVLASLGVVLGSLFQSTGTASAAPSDPTGITTETKAGTASATIGWTAPAGVTRYRVRAYVGNVAVKVSPVLAASAVRYTFTGLEYRIPYTLKVQAGDASSWGSEVGTDPASTVTPVAAPPSAPGRPTVLVVADNRIEVKWSAPASTGGAPIDSYLVQMWKDGKMHQEPVVAKERLYEFDTKDKKNPISVTVKAVNSMAQVSPESEESESVVAELKAAVAVALSPPANNPPQNNPSQNNPSQTPGPLVQAPIAAAPPAVETGSPAASAPSVTAPRYTKSVRLNSSTTTSTLLKLSGIRTTRSSKVTYSILSSSRRVCTSTRTAVRVVRTGTCSVKVTVKTGRTSTSRTVKLVVTPATKASLVLR